MQKSRWFQSCKLDVLFKLLLVSVILGVGVSYSKLYFFHVILFFLYGKVVVDYLFSGFSRNPVLDILDFGFFLILFFWYFSSLAWAQSKELGLQYIFYLFCGVSIVLMFCLMVKNSNDFFSAFNIIAFISLLDLFFSFLEALGVFRLPISPFSDYVTWFGRTGTLENFDNPDVILLLKNTPTGFHWNPNDLSLMMFLLFCYLLRLRTAWKIPLMLMTLFVIFMAGSRLVIISVMFVVFLNFVFFVENKMRSLLYVVALLLFISLLLRLFDFSDSARLIDLFSIVQILSFDFLGADANTSAGERTQLLINGYNALVNSFGFGVGAGNSNLVQIAAGNVGNGVTSMHNFWFEVLVEGGVFAALLMYSWYAFTVLRTLSMAFHFKFGFQSFFFKGTSLALLGFLPAVITSSSAVYFLPMWLFFALVVSGLRIFREEK